MLIWLGVTRRRAIAVLGVVVLPALLFVSVPVVDAAPLFSQINAAMREAGIAVNPVNWAGWAEGVVVGHYTSYQQLVDAMKWHKQRGRSIPDSSKFTRAVQAVSTKTKCMNRVRVHNLNPHSLEVEYKENTYRTIKLTDKQHAWALSKGAQIGATIKVCSKDNFKSAAGNVSVVAGAAGTLDGGAGGKAVRSVTSETGGGNGGGGGT